MKNTIYSIVISLLLLGRSFQGCGHKHDTPQAENVAAEASHPAEYYTCPMHPSVRSNKPGACPICGMTLVKIAVHQDSSAVNQQVREVILSPTKEVLANVATIRVETKALEKQLDALGKIDYAEPNAQEITTRFAGRIERLFVTYVGQHIRRGDPVAEIYSPDAISAQREFLLALDLSRANGPLSDTIKDGRRLIDQATLKLKLWGFTDEQIEALAQDKAVNNVVTMHSPITGTVIKKNVDIQRYVAAGEALFDVADLTTVWLLLDLYESDVTSVRMGQTIRAIVEAYPGEQFTGSISFISPVVEPSTRTIRVRAILNNGGQKLKPEMYAHASIRVSLPKSIVVPASAVIASGKKDVIWVERKPGYFEPREVTLGARAGELYQVLQGLHEGERVAVSGAYLIDSESQLQATTTNHSH